MTTILLVLSLIQALTLRGTVWEVDGKPAADATVTIVGSDGTLETTAGKDGTFKFTLPKPGNFEFRAKRGKASSKPSTIFVGQDMEGVGIVLRPFTEPLLGSVAVQGGQALPTPRPKIVIKYPSGTVANRCDISERGLFFCTHPAEFRVSVEGLPDGYFVKTMMLGDLDLIKTPVNVTDESLSQSLIITLALRN